MLATCLTRLGREDWHFCHSSRQAVAFECLPAQSREKDVDHFSPCHHHLLNICSLMNPSWRGILADEERYFWADGSWPLLLQGRIFISFHSCLSIGHAIVLPCAAMCIPSWKKCQPCSDAVFWRWYQWVFGLHPKKGWPNSAGLHRDKLCCWTVGWHFPAEDASTGNRSCLGCHICTFLKDLFFPELKASVLVWVWFFSFLSTVPSHACLTRGQFW